jgi:Endoplasmic Reticulum Oxidoreductin 1 (ERO1)
VPALLRAGCDYASVEQVNRDTVNPLLRQLVQTPFMRYFKVSCSCLCAYSAECSWFVGSISMLPMHQMQNSQNSITQVTLYCDCPFWPDDGMCAMRDCSVCECPPDEVPQLWKDAEAGIAGDGTCLSSETVGATSYFHIIGRLVRTCLASCDHVCAARCLMGCCAD